MARKAIYKHATYVDPSTYPDDGTSPVGTTEWNLAPDQAGMLGFTPATANSSTIIIASGVATVTDSVSVIAGEGAATDTLQKLALDNTNEYDLVYLFAASSGYNITLEHGDLNANGEISTISGSNETLSTTVPTILIRKGNYWYGYGGGAVETPTDITVADESSDTTCFPLFTTAATGDLAPKSGSNLTFNSSSGLLTSTLLAGALTGNVTGNTSGTAATVTGGTQAAITTCANLVESGALNAGSITSGFGTINNGSSTITTTGAVSTGALTGTDVALSGRLKADKGADVASGTATTLGADGNTFDITGTTTIVTIPSTNWAVGNVVHLQFDGVLTVTHSSATDSILLGDQGNMTTAAGDVLSLFFNGTNWVEISRSSVSSGGGATIVHTFTNTDTTGYVGTASSFGTVGAGDRDVYIKKIDANNEGVFTKIWKNGAAVEVQIG